MENKIQIGNAEIKPFKRGESSGCIITFVTNDKVVVGDKFGVKLEERTHYFDAIEIGITPDKKFEVKSNEVGYWARKIENKKDFDLRSIIDLEVSPIKDEQTLKKIHEESCWC